ncbi:hypothetical protein PINS_up003180 [Pythium insidiosum]|nr:hypothetical protein PINS_up003180 [Pythium insidiosum]
MGDRRRSVSLRSSMDVDFHGHSSATVSRPRRVQAPPSPEFAGVFAPLSTPRYTVRTASSHQSTAPKMTENARVHRSGVSAGRRILHPGGSVLLQKRLMEVEDYRAEVCSGRKLSKEEIKERYNTTVLPIPVPLARGESMQQYESRFVGWLRSN